MQILRILYMAFFMAFLCEIPIMSQLPQNDNSNKPSYQKEAENKIEKRRQKEKEAVRKQQEEDKKDHLKRQTKEVRKRMKQGEKETKRHYRKKKEPFYKRWLYNKRWK